MPFESRDGTISIKPPDDFESIIFDPTPFAEGQHRFAYKGKIFSKCKTDEVPIVDDFSMTRSIIGWTKVQGSYPCVVKKFKSSHAMLAHKWTKDINLLVKSQKLALKFNETLGKKCNHSIKFASPMLAEVSKLGYEQNQFSAGGGAAGSIAGAVVGTGLRALAIETFASGCVAASGGVGLAVGAVSLGLAMSSTTNTECREKERVCVEPFLAGDFQKLNDNTGWFKKSESAKVAQAFSHWTWHHTGGKMLVCDLQGMKDGSEWLLTDPAAHSDNPGFLGHTDMGPEGVNEFFRTHVCNEICKGLHKKDVSCTAPASWAGQGKTCYTADVSQLCTAGISAVQLSASVHAQIGGTCYAHAVASGIRAAEHRIVGRKTESHEDMVKRLAAKYGCKGADPEKVLKEECPKKRLHYKATSEDQAIQALRCGRPVIFGFWLTDAQWNEFSEFFRERPTGTLHKKDISPAKGKASGHAVVICGQKAGVWNIKNSWGHHFANAGYFSIAHDALPITRFWDIFWYETDLTEAEKQAWRNNQKKGIEYS